MKIGIMTFWWSDDNYGQLLQCYALQQYLRDADVSIVGSDQVWNSYSSSAKLSQNVLNAYFLNFGNQGTKRIAYAPSFGKDTLAGDFIRAITPLLKRFEYISVRETSGVRICRQCGVENAEWTLDPTLLLDPELYRALYRSPVLKKPDSPFCLLYILGGDHHLLVKKVTEWAQNRNIRVLYITGNGRYTKKRQIYASIPEWLYLIDNAEYVITNSYHCAVFSLLFQKKFGVLSAHGHAKGMNGRFITLFEQLKIPSRWIDTDFEVLDSDIFWGDIETKLAYFRQQNKLRSAVG